MSATADHPQPILCLGEAIVDLIASEEEAEEGAAPAYRAYFGGALANVAVAAARAGGRAALAGGVGEDEWGRWLQRRLEAEGVDLRWFRRVEAAQTPVGFVRFGPDREPGFAIYGDGIEAGMRALEPVLAEAIADAGSLAFGSNTLVGERERRLTLRARELALAQGVPILFDPNLRPNRWGDLSAAAELCREAMAGALLVRANLAEARALAGLGPGAGGSECAERIAGLGVRVAVVTLGAEGAVARGEAEGSVQAPSVEVVSPLGAGDSFFGVLAARLQAHAFEPVAAGAALEDAAAAGAEACRGWGALG